MPPKTSIIILCYNGLHDATKPCVKSVLRNTPPGEYELVLVDNASTDSTQNYLNRLAVMHDHVRICLNKTNRGFAGGNNDGISSAQGTFLVLLNNDTLVPPGWLESLLKLLQEHKDVGLVGPVTNSAGNEQRINLPGLSERNFESIAKGYTNRQRGVWFTTERLGFFCVAMRRNMLQSVGVLDEQFGIGMFEDDDFCLRVKKAGYKLAVAEDCFVYHKGSVSFDKLTATEYRDLFERNKSYFYHKHGVTWTFSEIAFVYWEKFYRDLQAVIVSNQSDPAVERILTRWENFRHLLVQIHQVERQSQKTPCTPEFNPIAKKFQWIVYWNNFKRSMFYGTNFERLRYVMRVSRVIFNKFSYHQGINYRQLIYALTTIKQEAKGQKIVIFPATIDFTHMRQRPQQLAEAFVDSGFVAIYGTLNYHSDSVKTIQKVRDGLYLMHENFFPLLSHVFQHEEVIYYCMWPNNRKHLDVIPYGKIIYDYMDELCLLELPEAQMNEDHRFMLAHADLITVSADKLLKDIPLDYYSKTILMPNAVSEQFIEDLKNPTSQPPELAKYCDRPIIGYFGAIAEWFDHTLVATLAHELPHAILILIGPIGQDIDSRIKEMQKDFTNILILPHRSQNELIPHLQRFDVCIIPFLKNAVTDAVSPVKLFEYMAAGKPVVSIDLIECRKYPTVRIATSHQEFVEQVNAALEEDHTIDFKNSQIAQAMANTWQRRVQTVVARLEMLNKSTPK